MLRRYGDSDNVDLVRIHLISSSTRTLFFRVVYPRQYYGLDPGPELARKLFDIYEDLCSRLPALNHVEAYLPWSGGTIDLSLFRSHHLRTLHVNAPALTLDALRPLRAQSLLTHLSFTASPNTVVSRTLTLKSVQSLHIYGPCKAISHTLASLVVPRAHTMSLQIETHASPSLSTDMPHCCSSITSDRFPALHTLNIDAHGEEKQGFPVCRPTTIAGTLSTHIAPLLQLRGLRNVSVGISLVYYKLTPEPDPLPPFLEAWPELQRLQLRGGPGDRDLPLIWFRRGSNVQGSDFV